MRPKRRSHASLLPLARKHDLITRQIPGEFLVYDLKQHKAFCLNDTAASVWRNCNGKRTVANLTAELERQSKSNVDRRCVWLALDQLGEADLLTAPMRRTAPREKVTRRGLLRAGVLAATLPVVTMIVAPTPQSAATSILSADCKKLKPTSPCGGLRCSDVPGSCIQTNPTKCGCA